MSRGESSSDLAAIRCGSTTEITCSVSLLARSACSPSHQLFSSAPSSPSSHDRRKLHGWSSVSTIFPSIGLDVSFQFDKFRNAAKFRAKDSIHRNHFGRQKRSNLGTVSLGFGVHPLMTTASRGLQEISLGHTKLDIELQPEKPDCFRVVSSPTSSHRSLVSMVPAIAPKRSQILPLLDEANREFHRPL